MQAQIQAQRQQPIRDEFTQATGIKGTPKSREGKNIFHNRGLALAKTLKHVCTTAERIKSDTVNFVKKNALPVVKNVVSIANGMTSKIDKAGQGLQASSSLGGILRNINPITKMGGDNGFVVPNTSSIFYKAGTVMNRIGQKVAPVAKVLTSKTFQVVGFVIGMADDMVNQGKTFGQALVHNAGGVLAGIGGGLLVTGAAAVIGVSAPLWLVLAGAALAVAGYDYLYKHNKGFSKTIDTVGNIIDGIGHYDGKDPIPHLKKEPLIPLPPNY